MLGKVNFSLLWEGQIMKESEEKNGFFPGCVLDAVSHGDNLDYLTAKFHATASEFNSFEVLYYKVQ